MRKLREVLRLRFELHLGYQQIGRSCAIGVSTVCKYLKRAEAAGVTWPLPEGWDDARVEAALFPRTASPAKVQRAERSQPDFAAMHEQLRQHRHLTLQLLWEEYRQANPEGYRYSRFCELYQRWRSKLDVVLRQEHKAGEKMFVDWAGDLARHSASCSYSDENTTRQSRSIQNVDVSWRDSKPGNGSGTSCRHGSANVFRRCNLKAA